MEILEYSKIRNDLKTGDIVLFSGGGLISAGIKFATRSKWSHIGMVIKLPEYDFICMWESTTLSKVKDLSSGKGRKGVQMVPLSERIKSYEGDVSIRFLEDVERKDICLHALMQLRKNLSGRPYEKSEIELVRSVYDGPGGANAEDLSSLFCSELVAEAYQQMGLLDELKPSNEYTPADFSGNSGLELLKGHLSREIRIKTR